MLDTPQGAKFARTFAKLNAQAFDRRGFLTGAGKLAGAGAVAMALTGTQLSSVFANHAGTDGPDVEAGNATMPDPNIEGGGTVTEADCYDFDDDGDVDDFDILQFALFLEHLENAFYRDGLLAFTPADFQRGLRVFRSGSLEESGTLFVDGAKVYEAVQRVSEHETNHAETLFAVLSDALPEGQTPLVECASYNFEDAFSSVEAFIRTSQLLENTGVAAYVGAASCITTPAYLRVAASIATVEARHATYFDLLTANVAFPSAYDLARPMATTVDFVVSSGLVGSCPQAETAPQPPFTEGRDITEETDDAS